MLKIKAEENVSLSTMYGQLNLAPLESKLRLNRLRWYGHVRMSAGAHAEIFQDKRGMFVELGHFDKDFAKNIRKRGSARKHFGVFSTRYSQNYILNEKFNPQIDIIRAFLSKIKTLLIEFPSPPLVAYL